MRCFSLFRGLIIKSFICPNPHYLWPTHLSEILPHDLDEVRHGEVHDVVSPGSLQYYVGPQQVVAGE